MTVDDLPAAFDSLPQAWRAVLPGWTEQAQAEVTGRVRAVSADRVIGPPDPFRALRLVSPEAVQVVVFGQDPYPRPGVADGLAFSSQGIPPSLRRIFEVLQADRPGWLRPTSGRLDAWARQGVLLLNPVLTVEMGSGTAGSHGKCGWQALTSEIVQVLCRRIDPPVFLLWGGHAGKFFDSAAPAGHAALVLRTRHPSYDHRRAFMSEGSHFVATADLVNWWALR